MRNAVVAGSFYESNSTRLKEQIKKCFESKLGPGEAKPSGRAIAGISPHAGYMYSGMCAAHIYKEIDKKNFFVILGTNHTPYGENFCISEEDFSTPLGIVKNNRKFAEKLLELCKEKKINAEIDEIPHRYEHSIEVQLPFLQFIKEKKKEKEFSILPIIVNTKNIDECKKFAFLLSSLLSSQNFFVIASSDFTHYGYAYGFMPFPAGKKESKENLYALDKKAIDAILKLDSQNFLRIAEKTTICGIAPILLCIEICKLQKAKARLLKYYTSGDITNYENAVGYAAIIFEK